MPAARVMLDADERTLRIGKTADDPTVLDRMETVVAEDVGRFAFRETLAFEWKRDA